MADYRLITDNILQTYYKLHLVQCLFICSQYWRSGGFYVGFSTAYVRVQSVFDLHCVYASFSFSKYWTTDNQRCYNYGLLIKTIHILNG